MLRGATSTVERNFCQEQIRAAQAGRKPFGLMMADRVAKKPEVCR